MCIIYIYYRFKHIHIITYYMSIYELYMSCAKSIHVHSQSNRCFHHAGRSLSPAMIQPAWLVDPKELQLPHQAPQGMFRCSSFQFLLHERMYIVAKVYLQYLSSYLPAYLPTYLAIYIYQSI